MGRTLQDIIAEWISKLQNREIGIFKDFPFQGPFALIFRVAFIFEYGERPNLYRSLMNTYWSFPDPFMYWEGIHYDFSNFLFECYLFFADRTRMPLNHAEMIATQTHVCKWVYEILRWFNAKGLSSVWL